MTASCPHYGASTSSNFSSSISICKAGLRSIIFWSIICGVSSIRRKSAMSRPWLRCSSVAIVSNILLTDTERQTLSSMGIRVCYSCVAPRSGISTISLPANAVMERSLKQPLALPSSVTTRDNPNKFGFSSRCSVRSFRLWLSIAHRA